jgi:hypothetical protein
MKRWLRGELPLLVVVVYLPRIQILVGQSWAGTTLKGWPLGLSGRGSLLHKWPGSDPRGKLLFSSWHLHPGYSMREPHRPTRGLSQGSWLVLRLPTLKSTRTGLILCLLCTIHCTKSHDTTFSQSWPSQWNPQLSSRAPPRTSDVRCSAKYPSNHIICPGPSALKKVSSIDPSQKLTTIGGSHHLSLSVAFI